MKTRLSVVLVVLFLAVPSLSAAETGVLYGRWDQPNVPGYVRFADDGTFRWYRPRIGTLEGRYRLLEGSAIEMTTFPVGGHTVTAEFKYALRPNELHLRVGSKWVIYKKAQ